MSKKIKLLIAFVSIITLTGGSIYLLRPKQKTSFVEKEISIKQAELSKVEKEVYDDYAGFSFEYPGELTILEVELDNKKVYSSLEINSDEGQKLRIRIADTKHKDLDEWQAEFEDKNVIINIKEVFLADIEAKQVVFGAPKEMRTIAVENEVSYEITSLADDGYWDKIHQEIINSFEFKAEVFVDEKEAEEKQATSSGEIILIEEVLE